MTLRSTTTRMMFPASFTLPGHCDMLPAGEYEILTEHEVIEGERFFVTRRTGTFLAVRGRGWAAGRTELLPTTEADLSAARDVTCDAG